MSSIRVFRKDDDTERDLKAIRDALQAQIGPFVNYSDAIRFALSEVAKSLPSSHQTTDAG